MDNTNGEMNILDPQFIRSEVTDPDFPKEKVYKQIIDALRILNTLGNTIICLQSLQSALEWTLKYIYKKNIGKLENNRDLNLADLINNAEMKQLFAGRVVDIPKQVLSVNRGANDAKHDPDTDISLADAQAAALSVLATMRILCETISDLWRKKQKGSASIPAVKTGMTLTIMLGVWTDYNTNQSRRCLRAVLKNVPDRIKPESCTWTNSGDTSPETGMRHILSAEDVGKTYYCDISQDAIILHAEYNVTKKDLTFQNSRLQTSSSKMPAEKPDQTPAVQTVAKREEKIEEETVPKARAKAKTELEAQFVPVSSGEANAVALELNANKSEKDIGSDRGTKEEKIAELTTTVKQNDHRSKINPFYNTPDYEYEINEDGIVLTAYTGNETDVIVPSNFSGIPVVGIRGYAFFKCDRIKTITIPNSISSIEPSAFFGFPRRSSIEAIRVLDGNRMYQSNSEGCLLSIDGKKYLYHAPRAVASRTICVVPDFVTTIGSYAFADSMDLKRVLLHDNLKLIDKFAFAYSGINRIRIPDSVDIIGDNAFSFCSDLREIQLPKHLVQINDGVFAECDSLEKIVIPDGLVAIGTEAFWHCEKLAVIVVPDSVKEIGGKAFDRNATVYCTMNSFAWEYCVGNGIRRLAIEN